MNNKEELDLHLTLFELYRLTCQMYLLLYIKQTQPSSSEVQMLLLTSFAYISTLVIIPYDGLAINAAFNMWYIMLQPLGQKLILGRNLLKIYE